MDQHLKPTIITQPSYEIVFVFTCVDYKRLYPYSLSKFKLHALHTFSLTVIARFKHII